MPLATNMKLEIEIDVLNAEEVLKAHKGQLMSLLTDVMMSKDKLKKKVERAIFDEMIKQLSKELPKALKEEYINALVYYKIIDEDD